ncbi:PR5-like receptor kinase isoform X2 [Manihot esculenta]|uniref:PR5-like receptor kinase isoform X2 n=1 Tax=Manihot esculenta TaxID=3983 RepID=UPI000B5D15A3|nr:PR5-like receptor kinase isoform X2 [Manihot esculenta]
MAAFSFILLFALFLPVFTFIKACPTEVQCGRLGPIKYPFTIEGHEDCGLLVVNDCSKEMQMIQFENERGYPIRYQVESFSPVGSLSTKLSVIDMDLQHSLNDKRCESFNNLSLPGLPYVTFKMNSSLKTMYKCDYSVESGDPDNFRFHSCGGFKFYYAVKDNASIPSPLLDCSTLQLPLNITNVDHDIFRILTSTFSLLVSLQDPMQGHKGSGSRAWKTVALSVSGIVLLIIFCCFIIKFSPNCSIFYWKKNTQDHQNIEAFLKNHGVLAPKRYKYSEVKKMTGSFNDKLGQGGYGSVYKGKLPDGRLVAVKVLKESKRNGEEFINEVASISRTSHVNIVTLLGFCFEDSKRALIYEFMSKGSLEKYIYEENPLKADRQLGWETLHHIAIGIARGLEYLHRGCNTRILHFDIKPHNILLDETFCPKISDFGLAKICPRKESIISMMGARGTAGYIAPEVFCRNFGGVSHKSDVYSYGMLVLEMVGGRKNICVSVDNTSEIYFPHWIFKRLELGEELGVDGTANAEDNQLVRKMVVVSLWCIQTDPSNRPPMSRVVEMLQGTLDSLPIPPKPYLFSPPRSVASSSPSPHYDS